MKKTLALGWCRGRTPVPPDLEEVFVSIVLVVPLKRGNRALAEQLLAKGPPFDPEAAGLDRQEILISDEEAVLVFAAPAQHLLDQFMVEVPKWATAVAGDFAAGPPRFAETAYAWRRPSEPAELLSSAPTPGPGDSDGGDVFAP